MVKEAGIKKKLNEWRGSREMSLVECEEPIADRAAQRPDQPRPPLKHPRAAYPVRKRLASGVPLAFELSTSARCDGQGAARGHRDPDLGLRIRGPGRRPPLRRHCREGHQRRYRHTQRARERQRAMRLAVQGVGSGEVHRCLAIDFPVSVCAGCGRRRSPANGADFFSRFLRGLRDSMRERRRRPGRPRAFSSPGVTLDLDPGGPDSPGRPRSAGIGAHAHGVHHIDMRPARIRPGPGTSRTVGHAASRKREPAVVARPGSRNTSLTGAPVTATPEMGRGRRRRPQGRHPGRKPRPG